MKKIFTIFGVAVAVIAILYIGIPQYQQLQAGKTPISTISATNTKVYAVGDTIAASDFTVKATHEDGKISTIKNKDIVLSTDTPSKIGKTTSVTVSLADDESKSCIVDVENEREEVISFECGTPNLEDVKAVLYSNGELCFEGSGNVLEYKTNKYPWKLKYEEKKDHPITAVSFEDGVTPDGIDNWFAGMKTIEYIGDLPTTIQSAEGAFKNCTSLIRGADLSACQDLINTTEMYSGCTAMKDGGNISPAVRVASKMFFNCSVLQKTPDLTQCRGLTDAVSMFQGCEQISKSTMPPNVKTMESMFKNCINLKDMPEIPESVENMDSAFENCTSMGYLTIIPKNVESCAQTFSGCTRINGLLWVDANPSKYNGFLSDAAVATNVDLQGNSREMDILANTSGGNTNITVNGDLPNPDITSTNDLVELDEDQ